MRTSASTCACTAKASRTIMPLEYTLTGWSRNSPMSAKAAMSSKRRATSARDIPRIAPFRKTFSRPVNSGLKPAAELEQRRDAPVHVDRAGGRRERARDDVQQRALAAAVSTDDSDGLPAPDLERHVAERPELAPNCHPKRHRICSFSRSCGRS
jgi:hypothetical protein